MNRSAPRILWALAALLLPAVLVYLALAYLQSPDGLRYTILPLVRKALGADELTVENGQISLRGGLRVTGLRYRDDRRGLRIDVPRASASLKLPDLVRERRLELRDVVLEQPLVRIQRPSDAAAATDPAPPRTPSPAQIAAWLSPRRLPLAVASARALDLELVLVTGDRVDARIGPGRLEIQGLATESSASIVGSSLVLVAPDEEENRYAGRIDFTLNAAVRRGGRIDALSGRASLELLTPDLRGDRQIYGQVTLATTLREGPGANLQVRATAQRMGRSLGEVELSIGRTGDEGEQIGAALALARVTAEGLNPILSLLDAPRLGSGHVYGSVLAEARLGDEAFHFACELDATDVRRILSKGETAPPLGLHASLRGLLSRPSDALQFDAFDLGVVRDGSEVLSVALEEPFHVGAAGDEAAGGKGRAPTPLRIRADRLSIEDLRRVLFALGVPQWTKLTEGELTGDLAGTLSSGGLRLKGPLAASKLRILREPYLGLPPLELETVVDGRIVDFRVLYFDEAELTLRKGERAVATGQLRGRVGGGSRLEGIVHGDDLVSTLETLELHDSLLGRWAQFGAFDWLYSSTFEPQRVTLEGRVAFDGLVLQGAHDPVALPRVDADLVVVWPKGTREVDFPSIDIRIEREGGIERARGKGRLTPRPGTERDRDGRFELAVEEVSATRWLTLAGIEHPDLGPLPLTGQLEIESSGGQALRAEGVTRLLPQAGATATEPVEVSLEIGLFQPTGGPVRYEAELASEQDQLRLMGVFDGRSDPSTLSLTGGGSRLEPSRFIELIDPKPPLPPSRAQQAAVDAEMAGGSPPEPERVVIGIDLQLDEIHHRGVRVHDAHLTGSRKGDTLVLDLAPSRLAGGLLEGALALRRSDEIETVELRLRSKSVELAPLIEMVSASQASSVFRGRLDLRSALRAERRIGTPLRRQIQGEVLFRIRDGELRSSKGLVANLGTVFRTDLQQLVFSRADGQLTVGDDRLDVVAARLEGAVGTVDVQGTVTLDWEADLRSILRANPGVGALSVIGLSETILGRIAGITTVPVEITATGPLSDLQYSSRPLPPDLINQASEFERFSGGLSDQLDDVFGPSASR